MEDFVNIGGRRVREPLLWAGLGVVGMLVPILVRPLAVLMVLFPPLAFLFVGLLAWQGWRVRGAADADGRWWWTFLAWAVLTAVWLNIILSVVLPGGEIPTGAAAVATSLACVGGSVAIALGSHAVARRVLAREPLPA